MHVSRFCTWFVLLACAGLGAAAPPVYPISYSGGVGRVIYTRLTLLDPHTYTYSEASHASYSVRDSGHYKRRGQRLLLTSIYTVHEEEMRRKRVNGRSVRLPDTLIYSALFRRTPAYLDADTVLIKKRRVLVNQEFNIYMEKD